MQALRIASLDVEDEQKQVRERHTAQEDRTLSSWVNLQLARSERDPPLFITTLRGEQGGLRDGTVLYELAKILVKNPDIKFGRIFDTPKRQTQRIQNLFQALQAFEQDNCNLSVGTDGSFIEKGEEAPTMGLAYQLCLHYQISALDGNSITGSSSSKPKSAMVAKNATITLFNERLAGVPAADLKAIYGLLGAESGAPESISLTSLDRAADFDDGTTLAALTLALANDDKQRGQYLREVESQFNMNKDHSTFSLALTDAAIATAQKHKNIPPLISADDIVTQFNAKALLIFLSYFSQSMSGVVHAQTPMTPISSATPLTPLSSDGSRNTAVFGGPLNKIQPSHEDEKEDMHIFKSPQAVEPEPAPAATAPPAPPAPKSPTSPSDKLQQQIIDLRTQLADEKRDSQQILSVKNSAIESFQSTIEKLEEDLSNARKESSTHKEDGDAKTAALEAEKAELQQELEDHNQCLFQVQNASALEDTITKLQTELDELRVTNEDTNSKLTQTQQDLKEESYKDGQLAKEQLDEHIDSLMERLKKAEQFAAEASIAAREDKDGKLKQLNEQIEALQTQVSELQAQVDTAQSESAAATVRMGTDAVEIDHLCQRIESLEDENEKLKGDLENKNDRVSQIEDEHTQLKKELNEARDQAKAKEEENGNLKKAEESNKSATSVQRDGALKNVTELKQEFDQLDDEHCSLLEKQSQQQQQHAAQGDPSFYWKMATGILGAATILGGTWIYQANNQ